MPTFPLSLAYRKPSHKHTVADAYTLGGKRNGLIALEILCRVLGSAERYGVAVKLKPTSIPQPCKFHLVTFVLSPGEPEILTKSAIVVVVVVVVQIVILKSDTLC